MTNAATLGAEHGKAGASWVFDGNTDSAVYAACIEMDEAGDPEWFDRFGSPSAPLSGEWAEGLTPRTLAEEVGVNYDDVDATDAACTEYEEAFSEAWTAEVLATAHRMTEEPA